MKLWKRETSLEQLNRISEGCMISYLGIEFTQLAEDFLEATMPVDKHTRQSFGLLHGGASVVLAESIGSIAGYLCSPDPQKVVGLEINASHLRAVFDGHVRGVCRALHVGRRHQVWQIEIFDACGHLCCTSRLTTAIID
ncbi:putative conserved hypothetical protein [Serratia symbiotica str. Tucson]|uniref:Uncharacterized protein ydiI n=2 Tax=Serratia symbiotica TaxID=138074 RepID=E9CKX2_9GAMM|nr:hotdog fold thioesterase [Serratia symbiotica]EFW12793.1 putative conserved hypothetical protein [Serratia symbiotica str. Tucson]BBI91884.1 uncharacterized protein ydiI [Serratia symbiotica]